MNQENNNAMVFYAEDFGILPGPEYDCTARLQKALESIRTFLEKKSAPGKLVFSIGEYHFFKDHAARRELHASNTDSSRFPEKTVAVLLENMNDFTLDGGHSLFIFHGDVTALAVLFSRRITIQNLRWDYAVSTVSEMVVEKTGVACENGDMDIVAGDTAEDGVAVSDVMTDGAGADGTSSGEYTDFWIPAGCPFSIEGTTLRWHGGFSPYTGKTYWEKTGYHNGWTLNGYRPETNILRRYRVEQNPFEGVRKIIALPNAEKNGGKRIRIYYKNRRPLVQKEGFRYEMLATPVRETAGAFFWESSDIRCKLVAPHYLHSFGWLVQMCRNVSFEECQFVPRPGSGRLCASYADGIHVSGGAGNIVIRDCTFTHLLDDAVNVHGTYTCVIKQDDAEPACLTVRYMHSQQTGFPQYHLGDSVMFLDRVTFAPLCGEDGARLVFSVLGTVPPLTGENDAQTMLLRLNAAPCFPEGRALTDYVVENATYAPDVLIENCNISVLPTRGVLCTTRGKTVIRNNYFKDLLMCPIFISGDAGDWFESSAAEDVEIEGNTFIMPVIGNEPPEAYRRCPQDGAAAIHLLPIPMKSSEAEGEAPASEIPVHRNVRIHDNDFRIQEGIVLDATLVDGLEFYDNQVSLLNPQTQTRLDRCRNVSIRNNRGMDDSL